MRKVIAAAGIVLLAIAGCATMGNYLGEPDIKMEAMAIEAIDLEGITFRADYSVTNPYPLGIRVSQVATDVIFEEAVFVSLVTDEGLNLAAASKSENSILFKLPYDSIMELAGEAKERESLPFILDGIALFDMSTIPYLEKQSLAVPFTMDFEVPVFKPEFRISGGQVILPGKKEIADAFVSGGMNLIKATLAAGQLLMGQTPDDDLFEDIDLDVEILFDLSLDNRGGAPWIYDLKKCSVHTGVGSLLDMEVRSGSGKIDSAGDTIQMAAVVNTLEWGAFVIGLMGGDMTDSSLVLESSLTFPGLPYEMGLPLNADKEITLGSFGFTSK